MNTLIRSASLISLTVLTGCQLPTFERESADSRLSSAAQEPQVNRALSGQTTTGRYQQNAPTSNVASGYQNLASSQNVHPVVKNAAPAGFQSLTGDLNRGHALAQQGRIEEAKTHYEQVLRQQPNHSLAHHRLAIIADKQKDFQIAEYHYRMALARSASDPDLLSDLGYSYFLQEKYRQSEQALRDALRYNPAHARSLNNLGLLYGTQGDHNRALAMFRQTGSEQEAQAKLATLFSNGRNVLAGAAVPANAKPEHWPADDAGSHDAASVPGQNAKQLAANAPNEITRRLKEEMQRARIQGQLQRQQQRIADATRTQHPTNQPLRPAAAYDPTVLHPGSSSAFATGPVANNSPPEMPQHPRNPFPETDRSSNRFAQAESVRVADSQLNRTFRNIDTSSGNNLGNRPASNLRDQIAQIDRSVALPPTTDLPGARTMPTRTAWQNSTTTRQTATGTRSIRPAIAQHAGFPPHRTAPPRGGYPVTNADPTQASRQQTVGIPPRVTMGNANQATHYQTPSNAHATQSAGIDSLEDAQRTAAVLGMNAGPAALFPTINNQSDSGQLPMARALPGTGSRINGSSYQAPAKYATPQGAYVAPQTQYGAPQGAFAVPQGQYVTPQGQYAVPQPHTAGQPAAYTLPSGGGNTASHPHPSTIGQQSLAPSHPYAPGQEHFNAAASPASPDDRMRVADPLRDYQAQLRAHDADFNSMNRKLQAERQPPVATATGWPTQQAPTLQGHRESRQQVPQLLQRAPTTAQRYNTQQF